jgi:Reverse transcriptase (RNA-dependent DNA polymerase)
LYDLKQSPKVWYEKLSYFFIKEGFKVSQSDTSLFSKHEGNDTTVVLVYVDDIIVTGNNGKKICEVKDSLKKKFKIKDLGRLKYFLFA